MNAQSDGLVPGILDDEEFVGKVTRVACRIAQLYSWNVEPDDLEQEMWLHLLETPDTDLLTKSRQEILTQMAWRARDWARQELCPKKRQAAGEERIQLQPMVTLDDTGWEYLADRIADESDAYADVDDRLTIQAEWGDIIEATLRELDGSTAETIARHLMAGRTKVETAQAMKVCPATVTYNVKKIRTTMETVLSQARAC